MMGGGQKRAVAADHHAQIGLRRQFRQFQSRPLFQNAGGFRIRQQGAALALDQPGDAADRFRGGFGAGARDDADPFECSHGGSGHAVQGKGIYFIVCAGT